MKNQKTVSLLLRLSIASVFIYAAVAATIQPYNWIGYIPQAAEKIAPASILLAAFSLFQIVLGVWVLTGWRAFYSSTIAAATLLVIITANWGDINILFRDFAIFFASLALAVGSYGSKAKSK